MIPSNPILTLLRTKKRTICLIASNDSAEFFFMDFNICSHFCVGFELVSMESCFLLPKDIFSIFELNSRYFQQCDRIYVNSHVILDFTSSTETFLLKFPFSEIFSTFKVNKFFYEASMEPRGGFANQSIIAYEGIYEILLISTFFPPWTVYRFLTLQKHHSFSTQQWTLQWNLS